MKKKRRTSYQRPSRARPKTGWQIRELAQLAGTKVRTVQNYLLHKIIPRPPFRASATRYGRKQLLHLAAARAMRIHDQLDLAKIRARINGLSETELEAYVLKNVNLRSPLARALNLPNAESTPVAVATEAATLNPAATARKWTHIEVAPGLEIHLRDDAPAESRALAERLWHLAKQPVATS